MIAAAYNYAAGDGEMPREYELGLAIESFGAQAVLGRVMGAGEIRRIRAAQNVINAYRSRDQYRDKNGGQNWAEWAQVHPELARVLAVAERLVDDGW